MNIEKKKSFSKKTAAVCIFFTFILIGFGVWYYIYKSTSRSDLTPEQKNAAESASSAESQSNSAISSPKSTNREVSAKLDPSVRPIAPEGTFVSNHRPNLSGTPAPSSEESVCHTTPGASCMIEFSMGSEKKSLPLKVTDVNGNTNWSWDVAQLGLREGEWQVTAIAMNGNLTATTQDQIKLVVSR